MASRPPAGGRASRGPRRRDPPPGAVRPRTRLRPAAPPAGRVGGRPRASPREALDQVGDAGGDPGAVPSPAAGAPRSSRPAPRCRHTPRESGASASGSSGSNGVEGGEEPGLGLAALGVERRCGWRARSRPRSRSRDRRRTRRAGVDQAARTTRGRRRDATRASIPSGERYASAKRWSGSSSSASVAASSSARDSAPSAPVATSITARTPCALPSTRKSPTMAVASPRSSSLSSTSRYVLVSGTPPAIDSA